MDCTQAKNLIGAVIDGQASADERAALEEHVAHCAACSDEFAAAKEIDGDLRRLFAPRRQAAARLAERVAQRFADGAREPPTAVLAPARAASSAVPSSSPPRA